MAAVCQGEDGADGEECSLMRLALGHKKGGMCLRVIQRVPNCGVPL